MRSRLIVLALLVVVPAGVAQELLTPERIEHFLRTARVVRARGLDKGVTRPVRLTLSDGTLTHDAVFQAVDERRSVFQPARGRPEVNFVDSWRYNIAAYRLATVLGLGDMIPVTVEYRWNRKQGALSWWMDSLMDESVRLKKGVKPPDQTAWNQDMHRLRVFTELVHDTDRNLGNVLISPEWRVLMIDFTRAFRLWNEIRPDELLQCDRRLLAALERLTLDEVTRATEDYLTNPEAEAVLRRRDLIVAHFRRLIAERGEGQVLYP